MKNIFQTLLLVLGALIMNSCYYDAFPEYEDELINTEVSYQSDIVPLWGQCIGCHNGNIPPNLDTNSYANLLNGYVIPDNADASILYQSLFGTGGISLMPPGSAWSTIKTDKVKNWIDQGALNN